MQLLRVVKTGCADGYSSVEETRSQDASIACELILPQIMKKKRKETTGELKMYVFQLELCHREMRVKRQAGYR